MGIDVGGTFTDLVAFDEKTGQTVLVKLLSTPHDPSSGVIESINQLLSSHPACIELIVHASTIGTNLFLGQLGLNVPRGALVTTKGFRDVLEIGRQKRAELYNPFFERPKPLIEGRLRFVIDERVDYKGEVLKPVNPQELEALADDLRNEGIESVAIVFLHSYINPEHEKQALEYLRRKLPRVVVVASYEVDPTYREYERTSTTVVNSLLIPVVSRYLQNVEDRLKEIEAAAPLYIMQSNGGLATVEVASELPVATIESGPATGVSAAAYWSRLLKLDRVLSFDMGGTTAKSGVVIEGVPQMVSECEVGGMVHSGRSVKGSGYPVRCPFVDLAEVSGGGGTIARIDEAGVLMVGPLSAGADPGPACYGKGGTDATVTDANLALGRLSPDGLSGGAVRVYPDLAEKAIAEKIAQSLGISLVEAASGVIEIVNHHMMRALRLVSIERGYDPRDFTMLAFGGAGPMHAAFLAEGMGIKSIIIPAAPGVFSAMGLLLTDFRHDYTQSVMKEAAKIDHNSLSKLFNSMENEAIRVLHDEGFSVSQIVIRKNLALRYLGQSYELMVPLEGNYDASIELFHERHREVYGYASIKESVEVVSAHLVARGITGKPEFSKSPLAGKVPIGEAVKGKRYVYFSPAGWIETPIYVREALLSGNRIEGPAIIEQYDATNVIPPGWNAEVDRLKNLHLEKGK